MLTRSFDIYIQTIRIQLSLRGCEGDVSCLAVLQGPLSPIDASIHRHRQQGFPFKL